MKTKIFVLLFATLFLSIDSNAQLLNRVLKSTKNRVIRRGEDMLVDKASEALSRAIMRKLNQKVDQYLQKEYARQDSVARANGEPAAYPDYSGFLKSMNKSADVPASYDFDLQMEIVMSEKGKKDQNLTYYFSKKQACFAMVTEDNTVLLDNDNGLMVIYKEENGVKTASALPNMMNLAGTLTRSQIDSEQLKVRKTGKSKKIAGYHSEEYEQIRGKEKTMSYVTTEIDYNWPAAFGSMMKSFLSEDELNEIAKQKGMWMASYLYSKKGKLKSSIETKAVKMQKISINNKEYSFGDYAADTGDQ